MTVTSVIPQSIKKMTFVMANEQKDLSLEVVCVKKIIMNTAIAEKDQDIVQTSHP